MDSGELEYTIGLLKRAGGDESLRALAISNLEQLLEEEKNGVKPQAVEEVEDTDSDNYIIRSILNNHASDMSAETLAQISRDLSMALDSPLDGAAEAANAKKRNILQKVLSFPAIPYIPEDVERCKAAMDTSHEGLDELKQALLDEIALSAVNGTRPHPLLLVGSPGCGKTSLATSLGKALGQHGSAVISLSGKSSAHELVGSDKSWRAADFGIILQTFVQCGSLSPIIIFDELDKVGASQNYSTADSAFLDILQEDRAKFFTDAFLGLPVDLSRAWFIFTANTLEGISEPLLDRLRIVVMKSYDFDDMQRIVKRLIAQANEKARCKVDFSNDAIGRLVATGCSTSSVRPLADAIGRVYAVKAAESLKSGKQRLKVTLEEVETILRPPVDLPDLISNFDYPPGVVSGIAVLGEWGILSPVEAKNSHQHFQEVKVTGNVEQVMDESARIAYELADSYAEKHFGRRLEKVTINYTYSFQKRGDSASLATAIAIISDLSGQCVRKSLAITGAVSLKGNILPIGSVLAKVNGAAMQGADEVIVPLANRGELEALPPELLPRIKVTYASRFEDIMSQIFVRDERKERGIGA